MYLFKHAVLSPWLWNILLIDALLVCNIMEVKGQRFKTAHHTHHQSSSVLYQNDSTRTSHPFLSLPKGFAAFFQIIYLCYKHSESIQ